MEITTKEVKKVTVTKEETKASGNTKKNNKKMEEVGNRIRALREAKKLSQDELANEVGVSRKFLSNIENGNRNFKCDTLMKLAEALDTSEMYLLHGKEIEKIEYSCEILQLLEGRTTKEVDLACRILKSVLECFKMLVPVLKTE